MLGKKILIKLCTLGLLYSNSVLAFSPNTDDSSILFKVRGYGSRFDGKQSGLLASTKGPVKDIGSLFEVGYGLEGSSTIFFNNNLALEFSIGFSVYRTKSTALSSVSNSYNGPANSNRHNNVYTIPCTLTIQYHIAPYGAIRPYIGAGYNAAYTASKSKTFQLDHSHGPVIQGGTDIVFQNDTVLNLDIKQLFTEANIKYKTNFITDANGNQVRSRVKLNPTIFAIGFGWRL